MRRLRALSGLLLAGLLGACSILPPSPVLAIYRLPASALPTHTAGPHGAWALRINKPYSNQLLDSTRIAVLPPGNQISAYQGVRWSDRAPVLLRDRLIAAFIDDGRTQAVSSDESRLHADLQLDGDLRAFQSEYRQQQVIVHLLLEVRLVRSDSLRILTSRRFEIEQAASGSSIAAVVSAFGLAGDQLARELVHWTQSQGQLAQP